MICISRPITPLSGCKYGNFLYTYLVLTPDGASTRPSATNKRSVILGWPMIFREAYRKRILPKFKLKILRVYSTCMKSCEWCLATMLRLQKCFRNLATTKRTHWMIDWMTSWQICLQCWRLGTLHLYSQYLKTAEIGDGILKRKYEGNDK